jgi:hypothetical protein
VQVCSDAQSLGLGLIPNGLPVGKQLFDHHKLTQLLESEVGLLLVDQEGRHLKPELIRILVT